MGLRPACCSGAHPHARAGVINPITVSGRILANGLPAASHPEWIAQWMLTSHVPLPISLSNALSYLFPERTQVCWRGRVL